MSCCGVTSVAADTPAVVLPWELITDIGNKLAQAVRTDGMPDIIVGILRGGMIPAVRLAHALGLREIRALDVRHTIGDGVAAAKAFRPIARNIASLGDLTGLHVLLIDDVAGTGQTMQTCRRLTAEAGAETIRTATCVLNKANWPRSGGDVRETFTYIGATYQKWVVFPWENQ